MAYASLNGVDVGKDYPLLRTTGGYADRCHDYQTADVYNMGKN